MARENPSARTGRIRRRRALGSTGSGGTQSYDSGTHSGDDNEELDNDINDMVERGEALAHPSVAPRRPIADDDDFTPEGRMREVKSRGGSYEREYRLQLLHRMLMRRVPLDKIADQLGVSVSTIQKDRQELHRRLREEAAQLNMNQMIGDTMGFYHEIMGMSLRTASSSGNVPQSARLAAIRTALSARNDLHKFLNAAGVFDVLKFKAESEAGSKDISRLIEITEKLLKDEDDLMAVEGIESVDVEDEDIDEEFLRVM